MQLKLKMDYVKYRGRQFHYKILKATCMCFGDTCNILDCDNNFFFFHS